jgi:hypothetical protein
MFLMTARSWLMKIMLNEHRLDIDQQVQNLRLPRPLSHRRQKC